jgi:hypothetical protein
MKKNNIEDVQITSLNEEEIYKYIEKIKEAVSPHYPFDNRQALLVSDAKYNPVDFENEKGNARENYEYRLEKEYVEGKTFYITALEALMFQDYFGSMRVSVNQNTILPLKYWVFRDYGVLADEKLIKNQIEWDVQKFYQQHGLL